MRFHPGQSGNPAGRPPGARNKKTLEMEELLAQRADATVKSILDRAERGEPAAMRLCMERMAPTGANRPVAIDLPPVETPDDVAAATRVVMQALAAGAISARETINLLTVVERLARIAERVQVMRERHEVWWGSGGSSGASLKEAARAALAAVLEEEGIEEPSLHSPVNSAAATKSAAVAEAERLHSPDSAQAAAGAPAGGSGAAGETAGESLYSPVNLAAKAAARPPGVQGPRSILKRRRQALMGSVSPKALLVGALQSIDPRSFTTEQTWLASMLVGEAPFAAKPKAA